MFIIPHKYAMENCFIVKSFGIIDLHIWTAEFAFKSALPNLPMKQTHNHSELTLGHLGTISVLLGVSSNTGSIQGKEM